jgi:hypothetical protein
MRTYIVAACRLAGTLLPRLAVVPQALAVEATWGGWMQFLLLTRSLGINTLPFLARLPLEVSVAASAALLQVSLEGNGIMASLPWTASLAGSRCRLSSMHNFPATSAPCSGSPGCSLWAWLLLRD